MGKIIFLDVDGTLVDYENQIPDSAVQAVRSLSLQRKQKCRKNCGISGWMV